MKRGLLILALILEGVLLSYGQNNVFVLVDVSGSRKNDPVKMDAKQFVSDLVMGSYNANGWAANNVTDKPIQDIMSGRNSGALVGKGSWYCIMPFGNISTYKRYHIDQCKNGAPDFLSGYQRHYPTTFSDSYTYIQIAEAFTASLAKSYRLNEYYLIVITDGLGDQDDTNSKNTYDDFEEKLILEWGNSSSSIVTNIGSFTKSKYYVNLKRVKNVQGSTMPTSPGITPPPINPSPTDSMAVIAISAPKGKKGKESQQNAESVTVSWSCKNCPQGGKFRVAVTEYDGGKFREAKDDLTTNSYSFTPPNGKFKITVSSSNFDSKSDTTFVEVRTGGGLWWVFLLLLAAGGGVGYWLWNKRRTGGDVQAAAPPRDNMFNRNSGGGGASSGGAASNSGSDGGYF